MSHKAEIHPEENLRLGALAPKLIKAGIGVGILGLIVTVVLGLMKGDDMTMFFHAYTIGITFSLTIAVGALFFVILQHLVRAKWSVTVRRLAEILSSGFPIIGVLFAIGVLLPMLFGVDNFYVWANEDFMDAEHLMHAKKGWLGVPFFSIRCIIYFGAWTALARYFFRKSVEQDETGDPEITEKLRIASAPAIIGYAFATAFAGFDILMTLMPHFFSTIFGVYFFAGSMIALFATLALVSFGLQKTGRIKHSITVEHYHDVGKLLFAFVFFWGYIAFSQFMLIWYADLAEETYWYSTRIDTGWNTVSWILIIAHFAFPFVIMLSRWTKRILGSLMFFASWMLIMHIIDLIWVVLPSHNWAYATTVKAKDAAGETTCDGGYLSAAAQGCSDIFQPVMELAATDIIMTLTAIVGVLGLYFAYVVREGSKVNLIPTKDPRLGDSLAFENY